MRAVVAGREALATAQVELTSTRTTLESHASKGWTVTRLAELSIATGLEQPLTVESLEAARAIARTEQQRVEEIEKIDSDSAKTRAQLSEVGARFAIDGVSVKPGSSQAKGVSGPMRCQLMALCGGDQPIEAWTDIEGQPLETRLGDIAVAIVVHGERVCRSSAQHHREWVIKRKAEIVAEERRKEAERQRLERERLEQLEKARVGRLLAQAKSLREAEGIAPTSQPFESANRISCSSTSCVCLTASAGSRSRRPARPSRMSAHRWVPHR